MIRYQLLVPLKRSRHTPEHTARGVMVGVVCAMMPTVGIQMAIVFAVWVVARRLFRWDFSLINGLAWTWLTNVFTMLPIYYLFYVTGQLMLARFDDVSGYNGFVALWDVVLDPTVGFWDSLGEWADIIVTDWGVGMLVGCLPWAALCGWASFVWSLAFVRKHRLRRARRMAEARARYFPDIR